MPGMGDPLPPLTWAIGFTEWTFVPIATAATLVLAALYGWGVWRSVRRPGRNWPWLRTLSFAAGLFVIVVATQSSIGVYEHDLFWVHMVQHLLLIMVAPAVLVAGRPLILILHTASPPVHRRVKRILRSRPVSVLTNPAFCVVLYTAVVVLTHLTHIMVTVMDSPLAHGLEELVFLVVGYLYFLPIFGDEPIRWRLSYPMKIIMLVAAMPVDTFTGLTLIQTNPPLFGMSMTATDIHNGGAVMWIAGDFIMFAAMLLVFAVWASQDSGRVARRGWLEQVRTATFEERFAGRGAARSASGGPSRTDLDNDDEQLAAYNDWLADLDRGGSRSSPGS